MLVRQGQGRAPTRTSAAAGTGARRSAATATEPTETRGTNGAPRGGDLGTRDTVIVTTGTATTGIATIGIATTGIATIAGLGRGRGTEVTTGAGMGTLVTEATGRGRGPEEEEARVPLWCQGAEAGTSTIATGTAAATAGEALVGVQGSATRDAAPALTVEAAAAVESGIRAAAAVESGIVAAAAVESGIGAAAEFGIEFGNKFGAAAGALTVALAPTAFARRRDAVTAVAAAGAEAEREFLAEAEAEANLGAGHMSGTSLGVASAADPRLPIAMIARRTEPREGGKGELLLESGDLPRGTAPSAVVAVAVVATIAVEAAAKAPATGATVRVGAGVGAGADVETGASARNRRELTSLRAARSGRLRMGRRTVRSIPLE